MGCASVKSSQKDKKETPPQDVIHSRNTAEAEPKYKSIDL